MSESATRDVLDAAAETSHVDQVAAVRDWADNGPRCGREDKGPTDICFLDPDKRSRYMTVIREAVTDMKQSYKIALTQLRVEELIKEDDDLDWVASLALDIASAHILGLALKGLMKAKKTGVEKLAGAMVGAHRSGGEASSIQRQAFDALTSVSQSDVESWTKPAFDMGKSNARKATTHTDTDDDASTKNMTLSFIDELTTSAEIGFDTFRNRASAGDDIALTVMFESLVGAATDVATFKDMLAAKLQRFRSSGVLQIGRKDARDTSVSPSPSVIRDTRVVWRVDADRVKRLFYQSQDGADDPMVVRMGDPETAWVPGAKRQKKFGPSDPLEAPSIGREVPHEFTQTALDVSMQRWGDVPTLDPYRKSEPTNLHAYMFGSDEDEYVLPAKPPKRDDKLSSTPIVDDADKLPPIPAALDHRTLLQP